MKNNLTAEQNTEFWINLGSLHNILTFTLKMISSKIHNEVRTLTLMVKIY